MLNQKTVVKVKKLNPQAQIPKFMTAGAAAVDLYATEMKHIAEGQSVLIEYKTGLAFEIPEGHVGLIFPRSSISNQTTLSLANSVGVIDSDYRGEVSFRFRPTLPMSNKAYKVGDRVGQMIIMPIPKIDYVEFEELNNTERGTGGFGSTGS